MRACAELPKLCEFFHIPFQSGDNDILRAMKCAPLYRAGLLRPSLDDLAPALSIAKQLP